MALLWVACGSPAPKAEVPEVPAVPPAEKPYLSPAELLAWQVEGGNPLLVDVRPINEYRQGHIPGAVQLWRDALTRNDLPFGGMAATRATVEHLLDSLGLTPHRTIVAYDDKGGCEAARLWWILHVYGHREVVLLDGGWTRWKSEQQPWDTVAVVPVASGYRFPLPADSSLVATLADVKRGMEQGKGVLMDTRSKDEYAGDVEKLGAFRHGTIPGSVPYDWGNAVDLQGDHGLKDPRILRQQLLDLGIGDEDSVITFCHSGVRSAHTTWWLTRVLGMPHVRNYDGSWTEWSYYNELPVQQDSSYTSTLP